MCAENSHKHTCAQCSLALLFTLYARNYFRVVGSSLGSTPRLATPRALDIAQLAERLTVVDVLLQLYWALPIVINWSPVRFRLSRHASPLLIYFRVGLMTKWRNGSGEFSLLWVTPSEHPSPLITFLSSLHPYHLITHHFSPFLPASDSSPEGCGFDSRLGHLVSLVRSRVSSIFFRDATLWVVCWVRLPPSRC